MCGGSGNCAVAAVAILTLMPTDVTIFDCVGSVWRQLIKRGDRVLSVVAEHIMQRCVIVNCFYVNHSILMMPFLLFQFAVILWTIPSIGTWILLGDHYIH